MKTIAKAPLVLLSLALLASCGEERTPLQRIHKEKTALIASVPFAGPYFYSASTEMVGPEAELGKRIVAKIGPDIKTTFAARTFASLVPSLTKGETELAISVLGISSQRRGQISFSDPYFELQLGLITNPAHKLLEPDELSGIKIGVREGSEVASFAARKYPKCTLIPVNTIDTAVLALRRKEIDAIIDDRSMAAFALDTVTGASRLELHPEILGVIPIAVGVQKGDQELLGIVNEVVAEVRKQGLFESWLQEHLRDRESRDRLEKVLARHTDRIEKERRAVAPRRVVIRVSKDANFGFDIYRIANLPFKLTEKKSRKSKSSSRIAFRGPVGTAGLSLAPGTYDLSLQKYGQIATVDILATHPDRVTINIRFKKSGVTVSTT